MSISMASSDVHFQNDEIRLPHCDDKRPEDHVSRQFFLPFLGKKKKREQETKEERERSKGKEIEKGGVINPRI